MSENRPVDVERVACATCLKEVPRSEATVPEATEYVLYFCGLDCYAQWKKLCDEGAQPAGQSS